MKNPNQYNFCRCGRKKRIPAQQCLDCYRRRHHIREHMLEEWDICEGCGEPKHQHAPRCGACATESREHLLSMQRGEIPVRDIECPECVAVMDIRKARAGTDGHRYVCPRCGWKFRTELSDSGWPSPAFARSPMCVEQRIAVVRQFKDSLDAEMQNLDSRPEDVREWLGVTVYKVNEE